jgi:signal transduction histidine kinase
LLSEQVQRQNERLEEIVEQRTHQLRDAQAELVQMEKMAATGRLAAGVAHEINNPVSIIQNRLELLLEDVRAKREVPDMDAHLSLMHKHTDRISRIVSRLLSFARKSTTDKSAVHLDTVLSGVLMLVKREIEKRSITLKTDIPENLGPVKGNNTELEQVFVNLLVNAMDATDRSGEISLRASQMNGLVTVEVSDTGLGIPPENLNRIFDPFFTTKDVGVGTGLGLAITYRIVEDHGGRIDVSSAVGRGTTFILTFPAIPQEPSA